MNLKMDSPEKAFIRSLVIALVAFSIGMTAIGYMFLKIIPE